MDTTTTSALVVVNYTCPIVEDGPEINAIIQLLAPMNNPTRWSTAMDFMPSSEQISVITSVLGHAFSVTAFMWVTFFAVIHFDAFQEELKMWPRRAKIPFRLQSLPFFPVSLALMTATAKDQGNPTRKRSAELPGSRLSPSQAAGELLGCDAKIACRIPVLKPGW